MFKTRLHLRFEYVVVISMVDKSTELKERRNAGTPERRNTKIRNTKLLQPGTQREMNKLKNNK